MSEPARKRALILAGGGLKVAFQAGVLQVWLDEAGLEFDLADGASGGVFNLAMWCQGRTGTEIADAWRRTSPLRLVEPNVRVWRSLLAYGRFRRNVLRDTWRLDWDAIRRSERTATFNAYNFSRQELTVWEPHEMDEDRLIACVSLPTWFPPVTIDGDTFVDAVYASDADVEAALARGATELWVIWTVSRRDVWHGGFVNQYFQTIELVANWRLRTALRRIAASNAAIARGERGDYPHHVEVKELSAEVPIHYLFVLSAKRLHDAVDLGVQEARKWCRERGIHLDPPAPAPRDGGVRFTETMRGSFAFGGPGGAMEDLDVRLTVDIPHVGRFVDDERHQAPMHGTVHSESLGGSRAVERATFNLFVREGWSQRKKMLYRAFFRDGVGRPLTLAGEKLAPGPDGPRPWRDLTTLYVRILRGHVEQDGAAELVGEGTLRLTPAAFAEQLTSFRGRPLAVLRFFVFFASSVLDTYVLHRPPGAG